MITHCRTRRLILSLSLALAAATLVHATDLEFFDPEKRDFHLSIDGKRQNAEPASVVRVGEVRPGVRVVDVHFVERRHGSLVTTLRVPAEGRLRYSITARGAGFYVLRPVDPETPEDDRATPDPPAPRGRPSSPPGPGFDAPPIPRPGDRAAELLKGKPPIGGTDAPPVPGEPRVDVTAGEQSPMTRTATPSSAAAPVPVPAESGRAPDAAAPRSPAGGAAACPDFQVGEGCGTPLSTAMAGHYRGTRCNATPPVVYDLRIVEVSRPNRIRVVNFDNRGTEATVTVGRDGQFTFPEFVARNEQGHEIKIGGQGTYIAETGRVRLTTRRTLTGLPASEVCAAEFAR